MSLVDTTERSQSEALAFRLELPHSPEKIWRALTDPELVSQWLLPVTGLELEAGTSFRLTTEPQPGWDGVVHCRMLEVDPQRLLRYAWVVGDGWLDTVVTFTLEPTDSGTRLTIVQSGFRPEQKQNFGGARYGWKMMAGRLIDLLARTA